MTKALVVFSGGLDSTTCVFHALQHHREVHTLSFDYGQRNKRELASAWAIAEMAGALQEVVEVAGILHSTSPLVDPVARLDSYRTKEDLPASVDKTFVPLRNAFFLAIAYNRAVAYGCDTILLGFTHDGGVGYPDTREGFAYAMERACWEALGRDGPRIELPLTRLDKPDVVKYAHELPGCWAALYHSYTCYAGEWPPCGNCRSCILRERAFAEAGYDDPMQQHVADWTESVHAGLASGL